MSDCPNPPPKLEPALERYRTAKLPQPARSRVCQSTRNPMRLKHVPRIGKYLPPPWIRSWKKPTVLCPDDRPGCGFSTSPRSEFGLSSNGKKLSRRQQRGTHSTKVSGSQDCWSLMLAMQRHSVLLAKSIVVSKGTLGDGAASDGSNS